MGLSHLPLANYFLSRELLDGHYSQIIRGDSMGPDLKKVPSREPRKRYDQITRVQETYAQRGFPDGHPIARRLNRMIWVGTFTFHH